MDAEIIFVYLSMITSMAPSIDGIMSFRKMMRENCAYYQIHSGRFFQNLKEEGQSSK